MKKIIYIFFLLLPALTIAQTNKKPNIIVILVDDLGWGDVGYHGSNILTPNIDKLSREGVILNRFYTAPICTPTRVGLLTGRYPNRVGIRKTTIPPWSDFGLDATEVLLPQRLAESGYKNRAIIGKWHLGHALLKYHPMRRGFTHFYGHLNGSINYFTHKREGETDWHNDYEPSTDEGYSTDLITDEAVKCIRNYSKESPFFLYVAYNAPHSPYQAKDEDLLLYGFDKTKPRFSGPSSTGEDSNTGTLGHGNTIEQTHSAMVTSMDGGIGKILQELKKQGIEDNTIVLFHSDNGTNPHAGSNGELRGYKFEEWEGGVRVPAIVKWPDGFKGGRTIDQVMGYIDVMPTLLNIAGVTTKNKKPFDGINMYPVLKGNVERIDRNFYLGYGAIINNNWKLIKAHGGNDRMKIKGKKIQEDLLFSIPLDYGEKENVRTKNQNEYHYLKKAVEPYDAIKAKKEILTKGSKKGFKAPKNWHITKE